MNKQSTATVVAATTAAQASSAMGTAVFPVIAPPLASELGIAAATIGYQVSLAYGVAACAGPFMSFAVGRWGACRAMQVSLVLCAAAMAVALAGTVPALVLTSALLGLAMTTMSPASGHLLFRFSPPGSRNLIFSIKQTGVPGGWIVMALVAPALTLPLGWRSSVGFVLIVSLGLAAALQWPRARWDDDRGFHAAATAHPLAGLRLLWRYPVLRWLGIGSFFFTFVQLCLAAFLVTMLVEEAGYSLIAAGAMLSVVQAAGVLGRLVWGWLADRIGESLGVLLGLAATATLCCGATAFVGASWPTGGVILLFALFGLTAFGWNGVFLAEIARASPEGMVSVTTSAAMVWNYGGILIGPALFAAAYAFSGSYTQTYGWITLVAVASVAALARSRAARRREVHDAG